MRKYSLLNLILLTISSTSFICCSSNYSSKITDIFNKETKKITLIIKKTNLLCPAKEINLVAAIDTLPIEKLLYSNIETFLSHSTEYCALTSGKKNCLQLKSWLFKQISRNKFLPQHHLWRNEKWLISPSRQVDYSIHATKLLTLIASAIWATNNRLPYKKEELQFVKNWFQIRLDIFAPQFSSKPRTLPSLPNILIPMRAHNIWSSHSKAKALFALAFSDRKLFIESSQQWHYTLNTQRADGSLPLASRRGARALWYSNQVLSDLTLIYRVGLHFNINLFKIYPGSKEKYFNSVGFILSCLENQINIISYARENFRPGPSPNYKLQDFSSPQGRLSWLLIFTNLWPKNKFSKKIKNISIDQSSCLVSEKSRDLPCALNQIRNQDILRNNKGYILGLKPTCFLGKSKNYEWLLVEE